MRLVDSQKFIPGEAVKKLESEIGPHPGAKHAIGCAAGSDALLSALMSLDVRPGDEVLTTPAPRLHARSPPRGGEKRRWCRQDACALVSSPGQHFTRLGPGPVKKYGGSFVESNGWVFAPAYRQRKEALKAASRWLRRGNPGENSRQCGIEIASDGAWVQRDKGLSRFAQHDLGRRSRSRGIE